MSRTRARESPQDRRTKFLLRKWGLSRATALADAARNQGEDVPSAATLNLIAVFSNVSGTVTVIAIGELPAATVRSVRFTGAVPLVHSVNLLLPGAANHTAASGDTAQFTSLGGGIWNCDWYKNADGTPFLGIVPIVQGGTGQITAVAGKDALTVTGADIASAATTDLGTASGETVHVTGSVTITNFGLAPSGAKRTVIFDGAPLLTYSATDLILPTVANFQIAAGDTIELVSIEAGVAAGAPPTYEVSDGDHGDITVSLLGTTWTIDPDVISTWGRTFTVAASAAAARVVLLPSMTGNTLKVLRVNAGETDYELATVSGGSAPFDDATAIIKGSGDATKLLRIEVDGFTTGTTRVLTPPNANATIAGLEVAQTFTLLQSFAVSPSAVFGSGTTYTTRFGLNAGRDAATGNYNTAIGQEAGAALTSGSSNTLVGNQAGLTLTTGAQNVAIGEVSGYGITTGSQNFCLGQGTGQAIGGGSANVLIGYGAGQSLTGSGNVALGSAALLGASGSSNIAIGSAAAYFLGSGHDNVFIGWEAGYTNSVTTAYGTLVGQLADASVDGLSNIGGFGRLAAPSASNEMAFSPYFNTFTLATLSSTGANRSTATTVTSAVDNTDATRKYRVVFNVYDTAAREFMRAEGSGTVAKISFFGVGVVVRAGAYTQTYATATATHSNLTSATLTDNSAGTANTTVEALPDPADTPITPDALRDDLVANLIPALRNNIADLTAQVNALRVDLVNVKGVLNQVIDDFQLYGLLQ